MVGSMLFAFIGGMNYWWPKMFGKMINENWGRIFAIVIFVGFNTIVYAALAFGKLWPRRRR
jgi:cytochrome c oxidase subunit 1